MFQRHSRDHIPFIHIIPVFRRILQPFLGPLRGRRLLRNMVRPRRFPTRQAVLPKEITVTQWLNTWMNGVIKLSRAATSAYL